MAITQEVLIDSVSRSLLITTSLGQEDLRSSYDQAEFMSLVQREIALKVAELVFKQLAPVIDAAMRDIQFAEAK